MMESILKPFDKIAHFIFLFMSRLTSLNMSIPDTSISIRVCAQTTLSLQPADLFQRGIVLVGSLQQQTFSFNLEYKW